MGSVIPINRVFIQQVWLYYLILLSHFISVNTFIFTEKDSCDADPCQNGGNCTNVEGSHDYTCQCTELYEGKNCAVGKDNSYFTANITKDIFLFLFLMAIFF